MTKQKEMEFESRIALERTICMKNIVSVLVDLKINGLLTKNIKDNLLKQLE